MIDIKLYDRNLTSPTFIENLTQKVQNLKFTTKLNGGFYICSFRLMADIPAAWEWITKRTFYRLLITDGPQTLWEGRLEDLTLTEGGVSVVAYGYYANLSDIPYTTAFNANADVVMKAVLTAAATQINADQSNIEATGGPAITSAAASSYLDVYPKQLVEKLLSFSDDTNNAKWYFAIWEDRIPYMFPRSFSTIKWRVTIGDFARFILKHRGAELWNSAYTVFGGARTAITNNTDSQFKYGDGTNDFIRRKVISEVGGVAGGAAQSRRDAWIEDHKEVLPRLEKMVLGPTVYDDSGVPTPSMWVRAGDVLRVRDLVPASAELDSVTRDGLRTYFIVKTVYEMDTGMMRITPDTEPAGMDEILGKTLKDGG